MRRVPYDSLLRQASLSYPSAQLKRNAYGGMVGWPHWHVIIWGRLVVNWILEKVFSLLDSIFLSFLRWGKIFPLFGELLLTTTENSSILDGEYFSNSGRKNYGRIQLKRVVAA